MNLSADLAKGVMQSFFGKTLNRSVYKPEFNGWESANDMPTYKVSPPCYGPKQRPQPPRPSSANKPTNPSPSKAPHLQPKKSIQQRQSKNKLPTFRLNSFEKRPAVEAAQGKSKQAEKGDKKYYNTPIPMYDQACPPKKERAPLPPLKKSNTLQQEKSPEILNNIAQSSPWKKKYSASQMDRMLS